MYYYDIVIEGWISCNTWIRVQWGHWTGQFTTNGWQLLLVADTTINIILH